MKSVVLLLVDCLVLEKLKGNETICFHQTYTHTLFQASGSSEAKTEAERKFPKKKRRQYQSQRPSISVKHFEIVSLYRMWVHALIWDRCQHTLIVLLRACVCETCSRTSNHSSYQARP